MKLPSTAKIVALLWSSRVASAGSLRGDAANADPARELPDDASHRVLQEDVEAPFLLSIADYDNGDTKEFLNIMELEDGMVEMEGVPAGFLKRAHPKSGVDTVKILKGSIMIPGPTQAHSTAASSDSASAAPSDWAFAAPSDSASAAPSDSASAALSAAPSDLAAPTQAPLPAELTIVARYSQFGKRVLPVCMNYGGACSSGELVKSRGTIKTGEPNHPNTYDGCEDGNDGVYEQDESIEAIEVSAVGGGFLQIGRMAVIKATVYAYSYFSSDYADFYLWNNHDDSWDHIGSSVQPSQPGLQVIESKPFPLTKRIHVVRASFRYQGSAGACTSGTYNDRDDLVFYVKNRVTSSADAMTPWITTTTTGATPGPTPGPTPEPTPSSTPGATTAPIGLSQSSSIHRAL